MTDNMISSVVSSKSKDDYVREIDKICPVCNKVNLCIKSDLDNTVTLECPRCLYNEYKPSEYYKPMTDLHGRPIIPPKQ